MVEFVITLYSRITALYYIYKYMYMDATAKYLYTWIAGWVALFFKLQTPHYLYIFYISHVL